MEADKYLIPVSGFKISELSSRPPAGAPNKKECKAGLQDAVERLGALQERLYGQDRYSLLLVFQAMDAAGKDSTIRAVTSGVNPAGFQVYSFKAPSKEELDHDFLWRTAKRLPERGRIGIFNRSYYEETLVVRVHPNYLDAQRLPPRDEAFWENRFESIRSHEAHLARNGVVILKFWLNVSREEQLRRFLRRIDRPEKNWKFSGSDVEESRHWDAYMKAYESMLKATSRPEAPWFAIPADDKPFMRMTVAKIIVEKLTELNPEYPVLPSVERERLADYRRQIEAELAALSDV